MSGTISFPYYQVSNRNPGVYADIQGQEPAAAQFLQRTLLIGQMFATGTAVPNSPTFIYSLAQAGLLFGVGSQLYEMVRQYYLTDTFGTLYAAGVPDPVGNKATGTLTLTAANLGTGNLPLCVGGEDISTAVIAGDTVSTIAARIVATLQADPDVPVTATAAAGVVTLTALHTGTLGNDIDIRLNYRGPANQEYPVPGLTVAISAMTGGTGTSSIASALGFTGAVAYDFIGIGFNDASNLSALDAYFNFSTGRWSWQSMLYGGGFYALRGTPGSLQTFGTSRNGPNLSLLGFYDSPDPFWKVAADYTAMAAVSLRNDPNRPLQYIAMNWKAPPQTSAFVPSVRNTLLYSGVSVYEVSASNQVIFLRAVTNYQLNNAGIPDSTYLDVETMYGTMQLVRGWQAEMLRLYPAFKLFGDGNPIPPGNDSTTAQLIGLATVAWYRNECALGNAQDGDTFAAAVLSRNAGNGLVEELLPFLLPDQLRQIAGLVNFTKP